MSDEMMITYDGEEVDRVNVEKLTAYVRANNTKLEISTPVHQVDGALWPSRAYTGEAFITIGDRTWHGDAGDMIRSRRDALAAAVKDLNL